MSAAKEAMWMYIDKPGSAPKGPVPTSVLCRLLEKGVAGLGEQTMVWQAGMDSWLPALKQPPFAEIIEFHRMQWYYIDSETNEQKGPITSRLLLHRLDQGEIDGMTLVYGGDGSSGWQRIGENVLLKAQVQKMAAEEAARDEALAAANEAQMVFVDGSSEANQMHVQSLPQPASAVRKVFTADDGKRYAWDEQEEQWVETDEKETGGDGHDDAEQSGAAVAAAAGGGVGASQEADLAALVGKKRCNGEDEDSEEEEEAAGAPAAAAAAGAAEGAAAEKPKRKRSKRKSKKGPNTWIYVCGLPSDVTFEEIKDHFSKVGLIAISPYDQQPRIKIYRDPEDPEKCKGDCTICYNAVDSMRLAVDILHDGYIRPNYKISVTEADFSNANSSGNGSSAGSTAQPQQQQPPRQRQQQRSALSQAQIKVAKSAMRQALAWNEDDDIGVKRAAALRIVVLEGLFRPSDFDDPQFEVELEEDLLSECSSKCGPVEKVTLFTKNPRGIAIVKFATAFAAQECTALMNGRFFGGQRIKCFFWDGVTNYSVTQAASAEEEEKAEQEEEARLDEFGDWLEQEQEELPEEFQLRTE